MARRIALVLLLVLALAQLSPLACAAHCAVRKQAAERQAAEGCCPAMQDAMRQDNQPVRKHACAAQSRLAAAPVEGVCGGDAFAAEWRMAAPAQRQPGIAVLAAPEPLRPGSGFFLERQQGREARGTPPRLLPLRI